MHEEEFEDASINAEEEEACVGTIKRRCRAYLEYKNSRNGGRNHTRGDSGRHPQFHLEKRWLTWKTEFR